MIQWIIWVFPLPQGIASIPTIEKVRKVIECTLLKISAILSV
jgi:hypothetical protein